MNGQQLLAITAAIWHLENSLTGLDKGNRNVEIPKPVVRRLLRRLRAAVRSVSQLTQ